MLPGSHTHVHVGTCMCSAKHAVPRLCNTAVQKGEHGFKLVQASFPEQNARIARQNSIAAGVVLYTALTVHGKHGTTQHASACSEGGTTQHASACSEGSELLTLARMPVVA